MSNLATIVNNILADSGIDDINVVVTNGSYSNPAWITALSWSKITSTPTTLSGYGITDAVPANRTITINGTAQDLSVNRSWSVGTVTSVDMTVPTGFAISGRPITSSGTLALTFAAGYSLPTTAVQSNWTTAYNDSIVSAAVTGTTTKTLTLTQQDGGTITASWTDFDTAPVTSVFGRTGAVVATSGDYTTTLVTEGTNLYYTDARARAAISSSATGLTYTTATGVLSLTAGYSIPTTANQTNWTTAYNDSIISAAVTGTTTKTLTLTQQDGGTVTASWTDYDTAPVTSVNAGTGISVNQTTGAVTVTNTGVLSINGSTGAVTGIITTSNYNTYSPTLTGGGASGTWGINITGDAGSVGGIDPNRIVYGSGPNKTNNINSFNTALASGFYDGYQATGAPTAGTYYHLIASRHTNTANDYQMQIAGDFFNAGLIYYRIISNGTPSAWGQIWTSQNDGAGSGLDADLLDGLNSSAFALVNGNTSNAFSVFDVNYAQTQFSPSAAPRTLMNPMSIKMWDNYFAGIGLGADYGTVMQYYGRGGHVDTQVYFDANGETWYRSAAYAAGWQSWKKYLTDANYSSYALPLSGGTVTGLAVFNGKVTLGTNSSNTYNGNVTGLTINSVAEVRSTAVQNPPALTWHYEGLATRHILMNSAGTLNVVSPSNENGGVAILAVNGNTVATQTWVTSQGYLTSGFVSSGTVFARTAVTTYRDHSVSAPNDAPIKSLSNSEDNWIYLDSANSQWGVYHRNIDSALSVAGQPTLPANSIAFIGANELNAYICLADGTIFGKAMSINGNAVATQSWVTSQGYVTGGPFVQNVLGDSGAFNLNVSAQQAFFRFSTGLWVNGPVAGNYSHVLSVNGATDNRTFQVYFGDVPGYIWWRMAQGPGIGFHPWERIWTSANDGTGSGLDADLLDGYQSATAATANTIPIRDASGDIAVRELVMGVAVQDFTPSSMVAIYPTTNQAVKVTASGARTFLDVPTRTGGDASGTWGISVTGTAGYANSAGTAGLVTGTSGGAIQTWDIRTIAPSSMTAGRLGFGFTSWTNNNNSPWADYLHLRSYTDGSGGSDNLVMFLRNGIGMRIWQQSFGSSTAYSSYVDVLHSSNYNSYSPTLTGGGASGTWGINLSAAQQIGNTGINVLQISPGDTPSFIKIRTSIPFSYGAGGWTVNIKGFVYGSSKTLDYQVCWHTDGSSNTFYSANVTSKGSYAPGIRLARENGLIVIVLNWGDYWPKLYVETVYNYSANSYYSGWSWVNEDVTGDKVVTLTPNSNFGGQVNATTYVGQVGYFTNDANSRVLYLKGSGNIIQFQDSDGTNRWEVVGRSGEFYVYKNYGTGVGMRWYINNSGDHTISGYVTANSGIATAASLNATTYTQPGLLVNASGTSSSGSSIAIQQVTAEGWTGIFVDFEPYTGWGLYHDNPNNYFCVTSEAATGGLRSFTVPSRASGNRTAYEKIRFDQNNGQIVAGGSITAPSFFEGSDRRIKDLIEDNYRVVDIDSIKPKLYKKNGKIELGYYAQDVQPILSSAVTANENGYLSLSYREVHTAKIAYLEDSIEEIKAKILYLENQLKTKQ